MERILLTHWRAPGDIVCMTACVRDLALTYPGRYEIHVAGSYPELWLGNPYIARSWGPRPQGNMRAYRLSCCDALVDSHHQKLHYLTAFHRDLERQLQVRVPTLFPKGDLHLTELEKSNRIVDGRYWLIIAGGKSDMPVKIWSAARFQQVVDHLREAGIQCVQGGARLPGHWNPDLQGVMDYRGKTDLRGFLRLVFQADGILCPPSFPMHLAAVFDKPCVVIAGGREPWWWSAYTNTRDRQFGDDCASVSVPHYFLHSIGKLACCQFTGCWKTHVSAHDAANENARCELATDDSFGQLIPHCLSDVRVEDVIAAILAAAANVPESSHVTKSDSLAGIKS